MTKEHKENIRNQIFDVTDGKMNITGLVELLFEYEERIYACEGDCKNAKWKK